MRIWSIHPKYLDAKGLVALWRETLLAKHVLEGKTKGYKNHPQLNRFKAAINPVDAINYYLNFLYQEAKARGYNFDKTKFNPKAKHPQLTVTVGQILYEFDHLKKKLAIRDIPQFKEIESLEILLPHPIFKVIDGDVEEWEVR
ncbi:MAG: pyrimidine dimer DNA glycosylase/endonuclease V [Bacteroidetes bacterium]|nr:pyrimidine dimer DNA glycosylase/endonuclease V [Bacteroidota bacterium]